MALRQQFQEAHRGDSAVKTFAPDYYPKFHCIAGRCRHSCCIGWEIDIDEDTLDLYSSIGGGFGRRLKNSIEDGEAPHFRLSGDERCPFLTSDGLCDIILTLGEDALCQICADHPRFRSYFSDRVEMGLGLCCEAAAKLILTEPGPMKRILTEDDGEEEELTEEETLLLRTRDRLTEILWEDALPFEKRLEKILAECGVCLPDTDWIGFLKSLECLDPGRDELLDLADSVPLPGEYTAPSAKLCEYFLYRHLPGALDDGRCGERAAFAVLSTRIICRMWAGILRRDGVLTPETMAECARMYSSEYEYSDENTEALLDCLTRDIQL